MFQDAFVGRGAELAALERALEAARAGRGRLVLIGGEPGIGKTRLCLEFAARAARAGARVLEGRCFESEGAPAFWPWAQALRSGVRALDPAALRAALGAEAADLARLVPAIRERCPEVVPAPAVDAAEARLRLFDGVSGFLARAAAAGGLVVVLDDLHGADRSSLLLLAHVRHTLGSARVVVVGTYRTAALAPDHPLQALVADWVPAPGVEAIALRGLSADEVRRLAAERIGAPPPARLVSVLHAKTEGNPLFAGEYLRVLAAEGRLAARSFAGVGERRPLRVQTVIARQLAPLSGACRSVLGTAAVVGRDFPLALLQRLTDEPCEAALAEAAAAGVLVADPETAGAYRFAHALIRETLYEALQERHRAALHRRVAAAFEERSDADEHLAELAYHCCAADDDATLAKGAACAHRAGDRAMALLAFEEAQRLYELGVTALGRGTAPNPRAECELLIALGAAQKSAGDAEGAKQSAVYAAALARDGGWPELLAAAALGYGSDFAEGDRPAADPTETALLEEALERWPGGEDAVHVRLLARLAQALLFEPSQERTAALSQRAVAEAERIGDPRALAGALHMRRLACWAPHRVDKRLEDVERILELAQAASDLGLAFQARCWRVHERLMAGDAEGADAEAAACARLAETLRQPTYRFHAALLGVGPPLRAGRWADAERALHDACTLAPNVFIQSFAQMLFAATAGFFRGNLEPIAEFFAAVAEQFPNRGVRTACAFYQVQVGHHAEARGHLEALAEDGFAGITPLNWTLAMCNLAAACAAVDDKVSAATLYDLLTPSASLIALVPVLELYWGPVAYYLGILAAVLERREAAADHFERALAMNRTMGAWPWLAETQCEYARLLLAPGPRRDPARARTMLDEAEGAAHRLDMPLLLDRVRARREPPDVPAEPGSATAGGPVFRRDGDHWAVSFDGAVARLKDSLGVRYLAALVGNPGREMSAQALAAGAAGGRPAGAAARERARSAVTKRIRSAIERITAAHASLGRHLSYAVSTGHTCRYDPDRGRAG